MATHDTPAEKAELFHTALVAILLAQPERSITVPASMMQLARMQLRGWNVSITKDGDDVRFEAVNVLS